MNPFQEHSNKYPNRITWFSTGFVNELADAVVGSRPGFGASASLLGRSLDLNTWVINNDCGCGHGPGEHLYGGDYCDKHSVERCNQR